MPDRGRLFGEVVNSLVQDLGQEAGWDWLLVLHWPLVNVEGEILSQRSLDGGNCFGTIVVGQTEHFQVGHPAESIGQDIEKLGPVNDLV